MHTTSTEDLPELLPDSPAIRLTLLGIAWVVALIAAGLALHSAWHSFDNAIEATNRADGNGGHCTIDFGGQWLMGRMLVAGHGRELYNRDVQRTVLTPAFPLEDQDPSVKQSDAEALMGWLMDAGPASGTTAAERPVGGPLYPPINAFYFAPLGALPPRVGYRVNQVFGTLLAFVAGLAIARIARGRIWWPVAATAIILYPGFIGSLNLGQNAALTLAILCWGWVLVDRGRSGWAGVVWGLLAFKPVWAAAFFLVPLLTGRWRMCLTMLLSGVALAAATLPVVGLHSWFDWLAVGKVAAVTYNTDKNWIFLSRDVLGIPRRWLLDFETPVEDRDRLAAWVIGIASIGFAFALTTVMALLRRDRARQTTGPGPAFVLLGAWMGCYHFMYYDVLLTALPVLLLFTEPARWLVPRFVAIVPVGPCRLGHDVVDYYAPLLPGGYPPMLPLLAIGYQNVCVLNRLVPHLVIVLVLTQFLFFKLGLGGFHGPPWDTFVLIAMWLWLGGVLLVGSE